MHAPPSVPVPAWNGPRWSAPGTCCIHVAASDQAGGGNNSALRIKTDSNKRVMAFLSKKIKHVIYVVKENRTFDQVLGDLNNGSEGDSRLTVFGEAITPSHHALARNFVTLDNFYDPGDGGMDAGPGPCRAA